MRLAFVYQPVQDLEAALTFYRDNLGWEELWREGETTAALKLPESDVGLLLDRDAAEPPKSGPTFEVESVDVFYDEHFNVLRFVIAPRDISGGRYAAFEDPSGNVIRLMDRSRPAPGV